MSFSLHSCATDLDKGPKGGFRFMLSEERPSSRLPIVTSTDAEPEVRVMAQEVIQ